MRRFAIFSVIAILVVAKTSAFPRVRYPFYTLEESQKQITTKKPSVPIFSSRNVFGSIKVNTDFSPTSLDKYTRKLATYRRRIFSWHPESDLLRGFFRI